MKGVLKEHLVAGRYQLVRKLGQGGMGMVYLVRDTLKKHDTSTLALKFLPKFADPRRVEDFKREFTLLSQLHHPYLAQVYDLGLDRKRQQFFFTQEFIDGKDLFHVSREVDLEQVAIWLAEICQVLSFLHRQGVLHNDLKPANILVDKSHVRLLDFGISSIRDYKKNPFSKLNLVGTPGYLAPELIRGQRQSVASDLFSLGMVFFKILAGRLPYEDRSTHEILEQTLVKGIPSLASMKPDLPPQLIHLVSCLTASQPEQRPDSAEAALIQLSRCVQSPYLPQLIERGASGIFSGSFVGRQENKDTLLTYINQSIPNPLKPGEEWQDIGERRKRRKFFQIIGHEGFGKSRLLRELGQHLQVHDFAFCLGRCADEGSGIYRPWERIFSQLRMYAEESAALRQLEQMIYAQPQFANEYLEGSESKMDERLRFSHACTEVLREISAQIPVIIALDDLHLAEETTLELFSYFLRSNLERVVFLAACENREEEGFENFCRQYGGKGLTLAPLKLTDVHRLLDSFFGSRRLSSKTIERAYALSRGIPGSIHALVGKAYCNKTYSPVRLDELLKSLKQADLGLEKSFAKFSTQRQNLLRACAIFSGPFTLTDLDRVLSVPKQQLASDLEAEVQCGILRFLAGQAYEWAQKSQRLLFLQFLQASKPGREQLAQLHHRFAENLVREKTTFLTLREMERICLHFFAATDKGSATYWSFRLGQEYVARRLFERAERFFLQARKGSKTLQEGDKQALEYGLAQVYLALGRDQEALPILERQISQLEGQGSRQARLIRDLVMIHRNAMRDSKGLEIARQALRLLDDQDDVLLQARLLAQAALLEARLGNVRAARESIDQALGLLDEEKNPFEQAELRNISASLSLDFFQDPQEAIKELQRARKAYELAHEERGLAVVYSNLGIAYGRLGDLAQEKDCFAKGLRAARRSGDVLRMVHGLHNLGNSALKRGEIVQAKTFYQEAMELVVLIHYQPMRIRMAFNLARTAHLLADYEGGIRFYQSGFRLAEAMKIQHRYWSDLFSWAALYLSIGQAKESDNLLNLPWIEVAAKNTAVKSATLMLRAEGLAQQGKPQQCNQLLEQAKEICPPEQRLDVEAVFARNLLRQKDSSASRKISLQECLAHLEAGFRQLNPEQNLFQYLSLALLIMEIHCQLGDRPSERLSQGLALEKKFQAQWKSLPDYEIELQLNLAQLCYTSGDALAAYGRLNRAESLLREIEFRLSPARRKNFLGSPSQQRLREMFTVLRSDQHGRVHEMENLRVELSAASQLSQILLVVLRNSSERPALVEKALHLGMDLLNTRHGVLMMQKKNGLAILRAAASGTKSPWWPKKSLEETLLKKAAEALLLGKAVSTGTYQLFPFYRFSPAHTQANPLGVIGFEMESLSEVNRSLMEIFSAALALLITQQVDLQSMRRRVETTSTELSTMLVGMEKQQQKLQLLYRYDRLVGGRSESMRHALEMLDKIIPTLSPVLIEGESGTGKELVAQTIHYSGPLATKPMLSINCAALSLQVLESQLFGHVKGAFTGALQDQVGLMVAADGGTLFLDEISEMDLDMQGKLLRVLQDGEIRPVGGTEIRHVKFRLITATNRDLKKAIAQGRFREDLYYRLHVLSVKLPALRERREDIPLLIAHFLGEICSRQGKALKQISPRARKVLHYAAWPGNVRQLQNTLELMVSMSSGRRLEFEDLPPELTQQSKSIALLALEEAKERFARNYFKEILAYTQGNVSEAARLAKIPRPSFHRQMKIYLKD